MRGKNQTYTTESRESAAESANGLDRSITYVVKDLGINVITLIIWILFEYYKLHNGVNFLWFWRVGENELDVQWDFLSLVGRHWD